MAAMLVGLPGATEAARDPAGGADTPAVGLSATVPVGFRDTVVFSGLTYPTAVRFSPDGRIFVAEKNGRLKVFDGPGDTTATTVANLSAETHDYWDRGLLGLELHPDFPATPYAYLLYAYDAPPGGTAPVWNDACPTPPGPTTDGCTVTGKLVRLQLSGNTVAGSTTLIENEWCQQYPSHSLGDLRFGPDGMLYVSGGEGASFTFADYGQGGGGTNSPTPTNPCGDPPGEAGTALTPPTSRGGALRSQSLQRPAGEPRLLSGTVLRIDPTTGAGLPDNPLGGSTDANARRVVAQGFRNPFRFTFRPGTSELWVGDVGWTHWEEINRRVVPTDPLGNYGWPCYEGNGPQPGYQAAGLDLCASLYSAAGSVTAPYYTYPHGEEVVGGDGCPMGNGSAITGLAFYPGGEYPAHYDGALFFADHSRNCIWAMPRGAGGLPAPTTRELFVAGAANPVALEIGPNGDLFYVDFEGGSIHRITYDSSGGCAPETFSASYHNNVTLTGTPVLTRCEPTIDNEWGLGAPAPGVNADTFSTVWLGTFSFAAGSYLFSATADDGIRVYVDGALAIDGWRDQAATTYTATRTLSAGSHVVRVEYYERAGDAVAKVWWEPEVTGSCDGRFAAQYFPNVTLGGAPVLSRCEQAVDYDWGSGSPDATVPADRFSARWRGTFDFAGGSYTFRATADDGIRVLVDGTPVINEWKDQAATSYAATTTLSAGPHTVVVEYYEQGGGAVARASWERNAPNTAPTATIAVPTAAVTWAVGDAISFSGSATDPEQGTLPASALSWALVLHHCTTPTSCHTHPVRSWQAVGSGSFNAPDHSYPSHLELTLTATDAGGLTGSTSVRLDPRTVTLRFASDPPGLSLAVDSATQTAPFDRTMIVGSTTSVSAPTSQSAGGTTYAFASWSDGGAATHNITAPATARTYTATYAAQTPGSCAGQFTATYFNNVTMAGAPVVTRCESAVDYDWGSGSPAAGVNTNNFSAVWQGTFDFAAGAHLFSATADDGVRVYVDGALVIDAWSDQAETTYTATRTLTAGSHAVRVEYYERGGGAVARVWWQAQGGGACAGQFSAQYFSNTTLGGAPVLSRCEPAIDFDWGSGSPGAGVPADRFSARWTGSFDFAGGSYVFQATADDGIRVRVDGTLLIDAWKDQAPTPYSVPTTLTAGAHTVVVEFYEKTGGAVAHVSWQASAP